MAIRNVNIYLQEDIYNQVRRAAGKKKLSHFINEAVLEKLNKKQEDIEKNFQKKLIRGYQAMAKNKDIKEYLSIWDDTLKDN